MGDFRLFPPLTAFRPLVFVIFSPGSKAPPFHGGAGQIHTHVVQEMKAVLLGEDELAFLDQNSKLLLRAARKAAHVVRLAESDIVVGRQNIQWFPWVGTRAILTLSLLAKSAKIVHEVDRLSITYQLPSLGTFVTHLRHNLAAKPDAVALARLMPVKAIEKYDNFIPEPLLDEANARGRLDIREAWAACAAAIG
jgi:ATP-dependent Lhr-like helicase